MRAARESLGLGQAEFAIKYDLAAVTYGRNENGKNEAGVCLLKVFSRAGINANWLLTGEGPMLLADLARPVNHVHQEAANYQVDVSDLDEQPTPKTTASIDEELLLIAIRGIREARPEATPAQMARMTVDFYQRVISMELGEEKDSA